MRLELDRLVLDFRRSQEVINFPRVSYFYGKIGSGKSSIARLIDYCLGGDIELTPALQKEFVAATLDLKVNDISLTLRRDRGATRIIAGWREGDSLLEVSLPASRADGVVIPNTEVEVVSDLIFYLAKVTPPKVRRRKGAPEEHLARLSLRDLFVFCYLDQKTMDNSLFKLDSENFAIQRKSVDAIRYLLGYHQERVAELETRLQSLREQHLARKAGAEALSTALKEAGFEDMVGLELLIDQAKADLDNARRDAALARAGKNELPHAVDGLRKRARNLANEVASNEIAASELRVQLDNLTRHENELQMLSVRFQRTAAAREIVGGVDFKSCPRCTQSLPDRPPELCAVCGQPEHVTSAHESLSEKVLNQDLKSRQLELRDTITRMQTQLDRITRRVREMGEEKAQAEHALDEQMREYDSAHMSQALEHQRRVVTLEQKLNNLLHSRKLPQVLEEQQRLADELAGEEATVRAQLETARKVAYRDSRNILRLGDLLLEILIRIGYPDVRPFFSVRIDPNTFDPKVMLSEAEDITLSFSNVGSGGMQALFKTCYALAIHRLCREIGSELPNLIIIDTPTKNVSSKENPEVFQALYDYVYELADGELQNTQFVIIDNEFNEPPKSVNFDLYARHMMNGSKEFPPLVPYWVNDEIGVGPDETE
ncbi:hypothetical protein C798_00080 [Herbaspirillum rubrisubalbicans Os34]|uniref:Rad50/SbcC-type AAA domain-containing protein n=1 Tax=Herbaspirillum rubrisubalbicans Os34 TaxID=1235827 RepID=A0A6M3ZJT8_9BURK|nr:hypothetical protein [Herbaspirillum rubrisubalbicans]QJP98682.1 hypothetical protein C798_00080 [Herbaspirillum rubrisubalbicans Os34]